ncbi:MAG: hypothetical protein HC902_13325 [Calothrix sp. SM1_5_4]|nr:hypothetical protein [Calothrix sp. SM1_5_4]
MDGIADLRAEALAARDWESVRDCDFQELRIRFDDHVFKRLYFGTPYEAYRSRMEREFKLIPVEGHCQLGEPDAPCLDVATGRLLGDDHTSLPPGSMPQRILKAMLKDLYRPLRTGGLFSELFHGEHFDIFSSPNRLHQLIRRTRRDLAELNWPLRVIQNKGFYEICPSGPLSLKLSRSNRTFNREDAWLEKIAILFAQSDFSSVQAASALGLSLATFKRLAKRAIDCGRLERYGAGPKTVYRITEVTPSLPQSRTSTA